MGISQSATESDWAPGHPVVTTADHVAWERWKCDRKLKQQRQRRAKVRRIDYYPSVEAAKVIHALCRPVAHCDHSGLLNRIVCEWASGIKWCKVESHDT
jgi:hypothetical protein